MPRLAACALTGGSVSGAAPGRKPPGVAVIAIVRRGLAGLLALVPTLLVAAALVGLFCWGATTNWTAPKFSELRGDGGRDDDAKKSPASEPDGPAVKHAWCEKHNVPEDQCVICHPELAVKSATAAEMKPVSVAFDPSATPTHDPRSCKLLTARIHFASRETLEKTGLQVEAVREQPLAATVTANATLDFDPSRVAKLGPRAAGAVYRVYKELGDRVKPDEVVALIDAAEVGKAKADFLHALTQVEERTRARAAMQPGALSDRAIREAEAALREARLHQFTTQQALVNLGLPLRPDEFTALPVDELTRKTQFLGLPAAVTAGLPSDTTTANLLPVVAPFAGEVIDRQAVGGEVVAARQVVLTVADPTEIHAHIDVAPDAAAVLRVGQRVEFRADGDPRAVAEGRLTWISPAVDEKTRLLHLHAEFDNPDGRLKAKAFGTVAITIRAKPTAVVVPEEAVQWEGCSHVVFIRHDALEYRTRRVVLGMRQGGVVEVLAGVVPGEVVATTGSHVLKSELLKNRIGGGED
jgi:membrane fusion protein, heavy metal efflux system